MFQKHAVGLILYWEMYVNVVSTLLGSGLFSGVCQQWERCPHRRQWQVSQHTEAVGHLMILTSSVNEPRVLLDSNATCVQILSNARVMTEQ